MLHGCARFLRKRIVYESLYHEQLFYGYHKLIPTIQSDWRKLGVKDTIDIVMEFG